MRSWPSALTLSERFILLPGSTAHSRQDLAERRLKRWKAGPVFANNSSLLPERLAADGISEAALCTLLGTPASEIVDPLSTPPEWAARILEAADRQTASSQVMQAIQESQAGLGSSAGFLRAASSFLSQAHEQLCAGIDRIKGSSRELAFDPATIEGMLLQNALGQILGMLNRTFVLELNVARVQGQLTGETSEERFASFLERLGSPEVVTALWEEYPVLARQVVIALQQWVDSSLEFLGRLQGDWNEIQSRFFPGHAPGHLARLKMGAGDRHQHGRSVAIAEFSSGAKLVYKPRALAVDKHFQELLDWVNARHRDLSFRTLKLLAQDGYGWTEYIDSESCDCEDQVRAFYRRQGGLLALLYLLHATDLHFENLVACGEHPVLVDLETLFHPDLYFPPESDASFLGQKEIAMSRERNPARKKYCHTQAKRNCRKREPCHHTQKKPRRTQKKS